ncbi:MAG TPA: FtsQ-type POTRA domain-containing protein [Chthonomonadaceae bacterium]|nr:FtsQ-type POTRA domain-containing protein [Chthonomonadaceae bacterium]
MAYEPPYTPYRPSSRPASRRKRRRQRVRAHPAPCASRSMRPRPIAEVYRRRRRALAVLYLLLGALLLTVAFTSPALSVKRIRLEGAEGLPAAEAEATVRAAALPPGINWLRAPVRALAARLRALPWVRTAQVTRRFPNTLQATITVRQPCVLVQTDAGLFEVDAEGVPIRPARKEMAGESKPVPSAPLPFSLPASVGKLLWVDAGPEAERLLDTPEPPAAERVGARLPLVALAGARAVQLGVALDDPALTAAIQIWQSARQDKMVRIAKIEVDQSGNICLNMLDGIPIQLGQAEDLPTKLALVRRIYAREPNIARRLVAVNLSCPSWPACTPRQPLPSEHGAPAADRLLR